MAIPFSDTEEGIRLPMNFLEALMAAGLTSETAQQILARPDMTKVWVGMLDRLLAEDASGLLLADAEVLRKLDLPPDRHELVANLLRRPKVSTALAHWDELVQETCACEYNRGVTFDMSALRRKVLIAAMAERMGYLPKDNLNENLPAIELAAILVKESAKAIASSIVSETAQAVLTIPVRNIHQCAAELIQSFEVEGLRLEVEPDHDNVPPGDPDWRVDRDIHRILGRIDHPDSKPCHLVISGRLFIPNAEIPGVFI
jgi:hypothetical protein